MSCGLISMNHSVFWQNAPKWMSTSKGPSLWMSNRQLSLKDKLLYIMQKKDMHTIRTIVLNNVVLHLKSRQMQHGKFCTCHSVPTLGVKPKNHSRLLDAPIPKHLIDVEGTLSFFTWESMCPGHLCISSRKRVKNARKDKRKIKGCPKTDQSFK